MLSFRLLQIGAGTIQLAADTIRIRYDTHVHDLRFQTQEFWISTT